MGKEFDWFDKPQNIALLKKVSYALLAATVAAEVIARFLFHVHAVEHSWDVFPGIYGLFGFITCALLIIISKVLGQFWLKRTEQYYD